MKSITPELINSLTPIFIATIGGIIGVTVLIAPSSQGDSAKWASAMGLAGTAIAGAAGLAQTGKSESTVSDKESKPATQNNEVEKASS